MKLPWLSVTGHPQVNESYWFHQQQCISVSYCQILYKDVGKDEEEDDETNSVADEKLDMQELESKF